MQKASGYLMYILAKYFMEKKVIWGRETLESWSVNMEYTNFSLIYDEK